MLDNRTVPPIKVLRYAGQHNTVIDVICVVGSLMQTVYIVSLVCRRLHSIHTSYRIYRSFYTLYNLRNTNSVWCRFSVSFLRQWRRRSVRRAYRPATDHLVSFFSSIHSDFIHGVMVGPCYVNVRGPMSFLLLRTT